MSIDKEYLEFRCEVEGCGSLLAKYLDQEEPYGMEIKCQKRGCNSINLRSNCVTTKLVELRCTCIDDKKSERWGTSTVCNKLLSKIIPGSTIEIKCSRCKKITYSINQFPDLLPEEAHE